MFSALLVKVSISACQLCETCCLIIVTSHTASTSILLIFCIRCLCCHSNETCAPIANSSNDAQLGGHPYPLPFFKVTSGYVHKCRYGQTDRQTAVVTVHFTWLWLMQDVNTLYLSVVLDIKTRDWIVFHVAYGEHCFWTPPYGVGLLFCKCCLFRTDFIDTYSRIFTKF